MNFIVVVVDDDDDDDDDDGWDNTGEVLSIWRITSKPFR